MASCNFLWFRAWTVSWLWSFSSGPSVLRGTSLHLPHSARGRPRQRLKVWITEWARFLWIGIFLPKIGNELRDAKCLSKHLRWDRNSEVFLLWNPQFVLRPDFQQAEWAYTFRFLYCGFVFFNGAYVYICVYLTLTCLECSVVNESGLNKDELFTYHYYPFPMWMSWSFFFHFIVTWFVMY